MELQGKKATYDFLSLYKKDSSFPHQDPRSPSQGFFLKTHDFLKPLERADEGHRDKVASVGVAAGHVGRAASVVHVLPGGIGTYSVSHVSDNVPLAMVKPERGTCRGIDVKRKPEAYYGNGVSYGSPCNAAVPLTLRDESAEKDPESRGQRPSPFIVCGSLSAFRNNPALETKQFMESASRSSKGIDEEEEEEEEESGRREGSSSHRELTVKVDGKIRGDNDQRPSTPRSKHSATEQRRRSKINDRFQILRELIPHTDQKRDKASFLLEVIEYVRFLQEKVQKYESSYLGWNQDNAKLMPWNNNLSTGSVISDPFQVIKSGSASPGYMFSGNDNSIPVAPVMPSAAQNLTESDMTAGVSYKAMDTPANISNADNMTTKAQPQWLRSSAPAGCSVSREILNEPEELTIDEGTISVSSAYSQGLLTGLAQALQTSGIDLSQASISVQINLGKRGINKRLAATSTTSNAKDHEDPASANQAMVHCRMGSNAEEPSQAPKRRKKNSS